MSTVFLVMIEMDGRQGCLAVCATEELANTRARDVKKTKGVLNAWVQPKQVETKEGA